MFLEGISQLSIMVWPTNILPLYGKMYKLYGIELYGIDYLFL